MHSDDLIRILLDMQGAYDEALDIVTHLSFEKFHASRRDFFAASRALEIISEASRRLPDTIKGRHPHLPWRSIRDVGNFYRHEYHRLDPEAVWQTIRDHLPALRIAIEQELKLLSNGG